MIEATTKLLIRDLIKFEGIYEGNAFTFMQTLVGKPLMAAGDPSKLLGKVTQVGYQEFTQEISVVVQLHAFELGFGYIINKEIENTIAYEAILHSSKKNILVARFEIDDAHFQTINDRLQVLEEWQKNYVSIWQRIKNMFKRK